MAAPGGDFISYQRPLRTSGPKKGGNQINAAVARRWVGGRRRQQKVGGGGGGGGHCHTLNKGTGH